MNRRNSLYILLFQIVFLTSACNPGRIEAVIESDEILDIPANTPIPTETATDQKPSEGRREVFEELGFSLLVPAELHVEKNPVPMENGEGLELYTFFIQDDGPSSTNGNYFQIYGLIQYSIPETDWAELSEIESDTENYVYVSEVDFNSLRGFETQLKGERGNYVFLFLLEDRVLRVAVSEASPENLGRAQEIFRTLEWLN